MKLVVLSESPEDEAAIRILVDGILGIQTELVDPPFRASGWSQMCRVLPGILKKLHYHSDADALAVIVDSDDSMTHRLAHVPSDGANEGCRRCQLRQITDRVQQSLTRVPNRPTLKTAFGLAVPALEAWFLCGVDPGAIEASLVQRADAKSRALRLQLKQHVYKTDRPSSERRMQRSTDEARRLVQNLDDFERCFPEGFGSFAQDVRSW